LTEFLRIAEHQYLPIGLHGCAGAKIRAGQLHISQFTGGFFHHDAAPVSFSQHGIESIDLEHPIARRLFDFNRGRRFEPVELPQCLVANIQNGLLLFQAGFLTERRRGQRNRLYGFFW